MSFERSMPAPRRARRSAASEKGKAAVVQISMSPARRGVVEKKTGLTGLLEKLVGAPLSSHSFWALGFHRSESSFAYSDIR